jgi:A/G-specific adenine glycosylase
MAESLMKDFSKKIMAWYHEHKRELPWRDVPSAYYVWLSEIILQQTRVSQGLPYYHRFVERYPSVKALASAPEQEVLRLWQGLGYYSRARNLHKCANEIVNKYGGQFPETFDELKKLPGIGDYTAAAIASISFKKPVAVVDGNVYRVLARLFGVATPINSPQAKKEFTALANQLISTDQPDIHNQAVMEFGALHCTPQNPQCEECPFKKVCAANIHGQQSSLPVKEKKLTVRERHFYYLVEKSGKKLHLRKRTDKDIWHGLYDFELVERKKPLTKKALAQEIGTDDFELTEPYKHVLSHQVIYAQFVLLANGAKSRKKYYSKKEIDELPKPVLISRFLADFFN